MGPLGVFGYGSLVSPQSAGQTLGREVGPPLPARLHGWRRRWSTCRNNLRAEKTFARKDGGELPPYVLGLNLEPTDLGDPAPNGALVEVGEAELERLDLREMRYDRIEVTGDVETEHGFDRVFAYRAKREHFAPTPPPGAVVMAPYLRVVQAAFEALEPGQHELFLATTGAPPVEAIEPVLVKDEIPAGNPRGW